jgi:hypothetical protein
MLSRILFFLLLSISTNTSAKEIKTSLYALKSNLLPNILAKELCSCLFVTGAVQRLGKDQALETCLGRANLPIPENTLKKLVKLIIVDNKESFLLIKPKILSEVASITRMDPIRANWNKEKPQYGCMLDFFQEE